MVFDAFFESGLHLNEVLALDGGEIETAGLVNLNFALKVFDIG